MKERIHLSLPHMGGNEEEFISEAFRTNWIAPLGPHVTTFEKKLEEYLSKEVHVASLSSGTAAIHLALILLGVGPGDEVLCQSMTFAASANPIKYLGATPIFVDSEPTTWNICPHYLEEAIKDRIAKGKKPKAIVAVHLFGMPYQVDEVTAISKKYEIPVVEDSAEALGSSYKNQKCGTFGDFGILSFNGNKIITTSGGGALIVKKPEHKERAIFLATQARDDAPHYQHSEIGYNYRLSNISAGIGLGQIKVLDRHVSLRRNMNKFYKNLFEGRNDIKVFTEPSSDYFSNHWLSCITFSDKSDKNPLGMREALSNENIETRPLWKPMHIQPVFKDAPFYGDGTSEALFNRGMCLPSSSSMNDQERSRITDAVLAYIN